MTGEDRTWMAYAEQRCAATLDYLATIGVKIEEAGDRTDWQGIVTLWPSVQVPSGLLKESE